jgi:hypothetical protein
MKAEDEAMDTRAVESASEPLPKRQSPRVWPPTHWGEWTYLPKVAVPLDGDDDDDEPRIEDLVTRGGRKVG